MDDHDEDKRTEHNLFVLSGKSEPEVTNNKIVFEVLRRTPVHGEA